MVQIVEKLSEPFQLHGAVLQESEARGHPRWLSNPPRVTTACCVLAKSILHLPGKGFPAWRLLCCFVSSPLARGVWAHWKEIFLRSHAAYSPNTASRSIYTHQATLLSCREEKFWTPRNQWKIPTGFCRRTISEAEYSFRLSIWALLLCNFGWVCIVIYICVYIYKIYIYKPPFSCLFKALIFSINQLTLVSGTFHLIFCLQLITRYCFSRKQATKPVWCSSPGFNTSGAYFQRHTAMPPHLQSLVPHLPSALWLRKAGSHLPSTITS